MGFGINYDPIVTKDSNDLLAFVKVLVGSLGSC